MINQAKSKFSTLQVISFPLNPKMSEKNEIKDANPHQNKKKYFRLQRYDKVWLLSERSLSILWVLSECFLNALWVILNSSWSHPVQRSHYNPWSQLISYPWLRWCSSYFYNNLQNSLWPNMTIHLHGAVLSEFLECPWLDLGLKCNVTLLLQRLRWCWNPSSEPQMWKFGISAKVQGVSIQ